MSGSMMTAAAVGNMMNIALRVVQLAPNAPIEQESMVMVLRKTVNDTCGLYVCTIQDLCAANEGETTDAMKNAQKYLNEVEKIPLAQRVYPDVREAFQFAGVSINISTKQRTLRSDEDVHTLSCGVGNASTCIPYWRGLDMQVGDRVGMALLYGHADVKNNTPGDKNRVIAAVVWSIRQSFLTPVDVVEDGVGETFLPLIEMLYAHMRATCTRVAEGDWPRWVRVLRGNMVSAIYMVSAGRVLYCTAATYDKNVMDMPTEETVRSIKTERTRILLNIRSGLFADTAYLSTMVGLYTQSVDKTPCFRPLYMGMRTAHYYYREKQAFIRSNDAYLREMALYMPGCSNQPALEATDKATREKACNLLPKAAPVSIPVFNVPKPSSGSGGSYGGGGGGYRPPTPPPIHGSGGGGSGSGGIPDPGIAARAKAVVTAEKVYKQYDDWRESVETHASYDYARTNAKPVCDNAVVVVRAAIADIRAAVDNTSSTSAVIASVMATAKKSYDAEKMKVDKANVDPTNPDTLNTTPAQDDQRHMIDKLRDKSGVSILYSVLLLLCMLIFQDALQLAIKQCCGKNAKWRTNGPAFYLLKGVDKANLRVLEPSEAPADGILITIHASGAISILRNDGSVSGVATAFPGTFDALVPFYTGIGSSSALKVSTCLSGPVGTYFDKLKSTLASRDVSALWTAWITS